MVVNDMNTGKKLSNLEVQETYWEGGFDMNIQDVGTIVLDLETMKKYDCPHSYFEHGIDEYSINPNKMEEINAT